MFMSKIIEFQIPDYLGQVQFICYETNIISLGTTFAPGIWVGTEGMKIIVNGNTYIILEVMLNKGTLKLNTTKGITPDSKIYRTYPNRTYH